MITANAGESVSLSYSGIHNGMLRLNLGTSWVNAGFSENWAQPKQMGDVVERRRRSYVADISDSANLRYGLFAYEHPHSPYLLLVRVDGPVLVGDHRDESILHRIEIRHDESPPCDITYHYGFGVIFGEEPLVERRK
ncbi:MAG TPA: hypothetical protein VFW35_02010 [Sphingomicrobium sp.]|nr:hypothetical protein [Sphingomicrobium sp.]